MIDKGYNLISRVKEGKRIYYNIEQLSQDKEILNNICDLTFKTKQEQKLKDYIIIRKDFNNYPLTKKRIADTVGIGVKTVSKWDNIMLDNKFMFKDGYFYMKIEKSGDENYIVKEVDKWEYNSYWKNKIKTKLYKGFQLKYLKGYIDLDEYTLAVEEIINILNKIEHKYYYKIDKYKINDNNKLFEDIYNLFIAAYSNDLKLSFELIE